MFYNEVVNEWGELTYVPTTLGNICLGALIALMIGLAIFLTRRSVKKNKEKAEQLGKKAEFLSIKQLVVCAMAIALGSVLSEIKIIDMSNGGSATLFSMLVICLPGYFFGTATGILTGVSYGVLQMIIDPYILYPTQLIVDYILAFGALGLSGLFHNAKKAALIKGYIVAVIGRYVFAVISGWIFFGAYAWDGWNPLPYSLAYNVLYIFPEAAITIAILCIPSVIKSIRRVKSEANAE